MSEEVEAWLLYSGEGNSDSVAELTLGAFLVPALNEEEVLVEPIFGCWEGNMTHAICRRPVDICVQRNEPKVVIGNSGLVRVLKCGPVVQGLKEGDLCIVFCNGVWDSNGYPKKIFGYDAPGSIGLLAKRTKLHHRQLIRIPQITRHSLEQWAAFSLRYVTAWANWRVAQACWIGHPGSANRECYVWGWGGGVAFAELTLARLQGFECAMISAGDSRLKLIRSSGLLPVDRRQFADLYFDPQKYQEDKDYRQAYLSSEREFLQIVEKNTRGLGVSIFVDFIGLPVHRATLKALGCPGIVTSAGWKEGMNLPLIRAIECMNWHILVHTHYARHQDALESVSFAEQNEWGPVLEGKTFSWTDIPRLANEHAHNSIDSYFPIYQINSI